MELNTPIRYTENTTLRIEQSGTYQIEIHGASGSGGNGRIYGSFLEPDEAEYYSGGSGGGGGYACSQVKMNTDDTIVLTVGIVGETSSALINSSVENYDTPSVTSGTNGKDGRATGKAAAGTGGVASYGNYANANGFDGTVGSDERPKGDASLAYTTPGGAPGHPDGNKGGNGGSAYKSGTVAQKSDGESGLPGFIIITLLSADDDSGSDEGETPTEPETPPSGTDPETPSQPSTTISDILTASSIQELKRKINEEVERRKFFGNISSLASWETNEDGSFKTDNEGKKIPKLTGINQNNPATANNINVNIIDPINHIFINDKNEIEDGLSIEQINNPIICTYINDKLNELDNFPDSDIRVKDADHGCKNMCTGFCSNACSDLCSGCGSNCSGTCSKKSEYSSGESWDTTTPCSDCTGTCNTNCSDDCTKNCGGCTTHCAGCNTLAVGHCGEACEGGCSSFCDGDCEGQSRDGTKGEIEGGCGGCASGCKNDCQGKCKGGCGDNCSSCTGQCDLLCAQSCSGSSYST